MAVQPPSAVLTRKHPEPAGTRLRVRSSIRWASPLVLTLIAISAVFAGARTTDQAAVQFVFTSDLHYGITRAAFRGQHDVPAHVVDAAMVARINALPKSPFPNDGGLRAGESIGGVDFLVVGGDIANRAERTDAAGIQPAAVSWRQFTRDFVDNLRLTDASGRQSALWIVPGNHDASNAVGFYKPMSPPIDKTSMLEIYNRMLVPATPLTSDTYDYPADRVLASRDIGRVHLEFLNVWPDSAGRHWMDADLQRVPPSTPVMVFTHDEPDVESKHFTNPNGIHDINASDRFENLLADRFEDGSTIDVPSVIEQRTLEAFLGRHPNITAYFHGNSNWNQFYDWTGPDRTIALHTFRVDSPIKGHDSAADETKLSFQVATIDPTSRTMTVRECLWNADPAHPDGPLMWGASITVRLSPHSESSQ